MTRLLKKKTTIEEYEYYDDDDTSEDPTEDPTEDPVEDPAPAVDEKYPTGDYRAGKVKPQGGDDYMTGNFGTTVYEQPTSKSSNWNSNGDALFPYFYKNDKGVDVEMDLDINEAIKGNYIDRVKVNDWPEKTSSDNPIKCKIQLSEAIPDNKRYFNLATPENYDDLVVGSEYYFDISQKMRDRGLWTEGQYNVNGEVLYIYLCSKNYSSGKMCIITDGGGTWIRKGSDWIEKA